jgi:hypothetical protein
MNGINKYKYINVLIQFYMNLWTVWYFNFRGSSYITTQTLGQYGNVSREITVYRPAIPNVSLHMKH